MFKNPLTSQVVSHFISNYQSLPNRERSGTEAAPYVYVDPDGVKYITQVFGEDQSGAKESVFAISIAGDGWMEMLAVDEAEG